MTIFELLEQYGLPTLTLSMTALCAWKALRRWDEEEKPKRKRTLPQEAYTQRLGEIEEEAAYQRALAAEEYNQARCDEQKRKNEDLDAYDDDGVIYKDER